MNKTVIIGMVLVIAACQMASAADVVTQKFASTDTGAMRANALNAQVQEVNTAFKASLTIAADNSITVAKENIVGTDATRSKLQVAKYTSGSGHTDGPKWNTPEMQYLQIGGREYGAGTVRGLGFGYVDNAGSFSPAFIGYQEASVTGGTNGDIIFGTRGDSSTNVPSERLRITAAGEISAAGNGSLLSGVTSVIDASRTMATFRDGDFYILNNKSAITLTIPTVANALKAGAPKGGAFFVEGYGLVPGTLAWGSTCYTTVKPSGYCPTSVSYGESWMFKVDGAVWRGIRLNPAAVGTYAVTATPYSIAKTSDGDYYSSTAKADLIWNMATAVNLQIVDGVSFTVASSQPSPHKITLNTADKFGIPSAANANGFTESTQLVIGAGQRYELTWNAASKHWHVWKTAEMP